MENWCEIFRVGTHTDSNGRKKDWTNEDLETIKTNFLTKNPDVPICCGHPKSNSPAYGWTDKMKVESGKLFATFKNVQESFKEAYDQGLFKTRSLSLTSDLIPRHIAFLGAQSPAIKGMEKFCFEECGDDICIEFQSNTISLYSDPSGAGSSPVLKEGEQMSEEINVKLAEKDAKIAELEAKIAKNEKEQRNKEFEDFCDKAISNGNILPAQKQHIINILESLDNTNKFEFDDGSEKNASEIFKDFIGNLKQFNFEEVATTNNLQTPKEIDFSDAENVAENIIEIQNEYLKKGKTLSAVEALEVIKRGK